MGDPYIGNFPHCTTVNIFSNFLFIFYLININMVKFYYINFKRLIPVSLLLSETGPNLASRNFLL